MGLLQLAGCRRTGTIAVAFHEHQLARPITTQDSVVLKIQIQFWRFRHWQIENSINARRSRYWLPLPAITLLCWLFFVVQIVPFKRASYGKRERLTDHNWEPIRLRLFACILIIRSPASFDPFQYMCKATAFSLFWSRFLDASLRVAAQVRPKWELLPVWGLVWFLFLNANFYIITTNE